MTSPICLSVVIPIATARLQNLNLVLASLDCQTYPKDLFEVILVNDGEDEVGQVARVYQRTLRITYVQAPKHDPTLFGTSKQTTQPRNRGARNALYPFLVFADSDVILERHALQYYAENFAEMPDRIVAGLYHWLCPMNIATMDIRNRFDDILEERLPHRSVPQPKTHMINRDPRVQMFSEQPHSFVFKPTTPKEKMQLYPKYLGCFSGNIAWNADLFWSIGGYWDALAAGAHEDGCSGLAACVAGIGLSFDPRIVGGHIYHDRKIFDGYGGKGLVALWEKEIPMINRRFGLEDQADESGELYDRLPTMETMSKNARVSWGVEKWETQGIGEKKESGFRGI